MADLITRLKVDSTEYDAKIKRAAQGLQHYVQSAHDSGDVIGRLLGDTKKYVESLGNMATVSTTARGRLNELTAAFTDLRSVYNSLSEEEKSAKGGFGQELNKQLEILKGRINDTKKELKDIDQELGNTKQAEDGAKSGLEGLTSALGINVKSLIGWGTALAAGKAALDVAKDAFFASEANVDEWGRVVDSSKSLYEGFLTALNTGDISGYLSRIDEIVSAARTAYNELDRLGTMKTIQAPKVSAQQTENERIRSMIQTGRYIAPVDGRRNAVFNGREMQNGDKLTAGQIRALEKQLQNGMQNVVKLVGNEVKQTGKAIDAVYERQAKELGISLKEFRKGTSSMEEFDKRMAGYDKYQQWREQHTTIDQKSGREIVARGNPYAEYGKWGTFRVDGDRYNQLVQLIQQRDQQAAQAYGMQSQAYRTMNRAEGFTVSKLLRPGGNGKNDKQEQTELQQNQKKINDLTQEYVKLGDNATEAARKRQEEIQKEIKLLEERNGLLNLRAEQAQGRLLLKDEDINREGIRRTKNNDLGLADGFDPSKPTQLSDKALKAVQKSIDKQTSLQAKELKDQEKQKTTVAGGLGDLAGGMNSVVGGLEQLGIEIPTGLKDVLGGMQAISSILTGIAATVIAIEAIAGADAIIPFANGGIVPKAAGGMLIPGNFMSGDRLRMPVDGGRGLIGVNSGELILSRSQQNNLANALTGGGMNNMRLEAVVSGEQLLLVQNHRGLRTGRGELVQSNRRR